MLLICQYIDSRKEEFGVEPICQALTSADVKIAPSTYYAAKSRPRSARSRRDEALKAEIKKVQENNYCVLDARKMHTMLNRPEASVRHGLEHVARCTVERLMRAMGLHGIRRAKSPRTTAAHSRSSAPQTWSRGTSQFSGPMSCGSADITYVRTLSDWVYVAFAR
ncbi:hypothetical protein EKN07_12215 [Actinobaculum sp. 352]|nr:hypothetical protein EKN07_12215 [Actinobaculum sp. 352]